MNFLPTIAKQEEISKQNTSDLFRKPYDYFSTKIPRSHIEMILKVVKDERFLFFIKYGLLRRYDGDCEIIYVEIPQIPKKLVVYRRPCIRMKSPEKLNLSSRDLPHIPLFEGEENLKILSLEMNQITKIDQLISLNNLSYLNLYSNRIKEIENLQTTSHLRVLLLGKNLIERIKNVHILIDLEILDLHSNLIKQIENLTQLRKLRILNIANNQLTSISELLANKSLEELNVRKNMISSLPSCANNWEKLRKINLGKNSIAKVENLNELRKLKSLIEVSLEENPVALIKECGEILKSIPKVNLVFINKNAGMMKNGSTKNGFTPIDPQLHRQNQTSQHTRSSSPLAGISSNHSINHTSSLSCIGSSGRNNKSSSLPQDQQHNSSHLNNSSLSIQKSIQSKWVIEYSTIIKLGYNGYNNKKIKEDHAIFGHIESGSDKRELICYGDALRVLFYDDSYHNITSLHFNYFLYDDIMNRRNIKLFQQFGDLSSVSFSDNNIHSFYQLIKLENFPSLNSIEIRNNEICFSTIAKYFLIYRVQDLKCYNEEEIKDEDVDIARSLFEFFDKCISVSDLKNSQAKAEKAKHSKEKEKDSNCLYPSIRQSVESTSTNKGNKTLDDNSTDNVKVNGIEEFLQEDSKPNVTPSNQEPDKENEKNNDKLKMKMLAFAKSNLDLVIKEIMYDFSFEDD